MFVHYRSQGFILKKEDKGEDDQLFTVFTKDFGKVEILGKAIRKVSSKLKSGAEIFYLSEIEFIQGKAYKTLTDAIPIEKFGNLRKKLERLKIAYKISTILDKLIRGQEPDEKIWQLLIKTFERLNTLETKFLRSKNEGKEENKVLFAISNWNLEILFYYFLWNFFSILGYQPELHRCVFCRKKIMPEKIYFSPRDGGIICGNCSTKLRTKKEIKPETVKILRVILERKWQILSKLKIKLEYIKSLELISKSYLSFIWGEKKGEENYFSS